jgi:hypothetical protein
MCKCYMALTASGGRDVRPTTHLVWTGKPGAQGTYWGLAQSTVVFASLHVVSWTTKTLRVSPTGRFTRSKTITRRFLRSLSNSVSRHKMSLYPHHLNVTGRDLISCPVTFTTGCSYGLTNARYCRYSDMNSWWWVEIPPETCIAVCRYK